MTTIILTQKLLTMKLDKAEFDRNRRQQAYTSQEKKKAVKSLKVILEQQKVKKTCRLCLKRGERKIFGENQDFDIALHIRLILGIEISEDDGKPQHLCVPCELTLQQASELRRTAEITQWRLQQELEMVAESPLDWGAQETETVLLEGTDNRGGFFKVLDTGFTRQWNCRNCLRVFHSQEKFSEHEQLPSCRDTGAGYVCETCGREFKNMTRLKRHRLIHTGSLNYACAQCPYRARSKNALIEHERCHSGAKPLRCPECGEHFRSHSTLGSHRRKHMPPRFKCQLCQKAFRFKGALQNHMATHSNAKPYNCSMCDKVFSTRKMSLRHELKIHKRPKMRSGSTPSYLLQEQNT